MTTVTSRRVGRRGCRLGVVAAALLLAGCGSPGPSVEQGGAPAPSVVETPAPDDAPAPSAVPPARPAPGTTAPPWLGTRVLPVTATGFGEVRRTPRALRTRAFTLPDLLPALPGTGFASRVADPAPADVVARSTWREGCPVAATDLAWVRVAFHGFDGARHTGELLVDGAVADDVVSVFAELWRADFPFERLRITPADELDLPPTGDGNDTGAFVCRPVVGSTSTFSQHAYGRAIDVDPFQNPYERVTPTGRVVLPELASAYLDRGDARPGMVLPDGPVVRAFARIGWGWGGDYRSLKDYQHFSANGR